MSQSVALRQHSCIVTGSTAPTAFAMSASSLQNPTPEQLIDFSQNCEHEAFILREVFWRGVKKEIPPVIALANNDDSYYTQVFRNRSELNAFIDQLQAIANEAWPEGSCKIIFELTQHEIAYFDSNGFSYKGQLIEDAGEADRLLLEVLYAQKQEAAS